MEYFYITRYQLLCDIKKRRWRHKESGIAKKRNFNFIADSFKFTQTLSDFLKDVNQYARIYHQ